MTKPLKISNLNKKFGQNNVLENVSFEVEKGEIFGLIGLNGVGKTTMIKIILGLLEQDSGLSQIYDINSSNKDARQNLSFLPEKFYPSQQLKGREFLELTCSYYKRKFNFDDAVKIANLLKLNPEVLNNKVSSYSKGMGQKLGLMSAFLTGSPFLMLDEPMSGLDPSARIALKETMIDFVKSNPNNTIFFSSHILSDIDEICDRIAILHNSKIIFLGKPAEFKELMQINSLERAFLKAIN
ncbi:MAG: ABC transporter ATP-binding protein [Rickettsiales bacterium]|nr:ABC transporter ATP-binding protein [Rickettsiales bacterium]